jgi:hypothetical protein
VGGLRCHVQSGRNRLNRRNLGTAAPHRRAAAPPHRRTLAPLHLQVFLSGPRKHCSGILTNGLGRALLGFTYWGCILLTIGLCFILVNANLINILDSGAEALLGPQPGRLVWLPVHRRDRLEHRQSSWRPRTDQKAGGRNTAEIEVVPKAL